MVAFGQNHPFCELEAVPLRAVAEHRYIDRLHCEFRGDFLKLCADSDLDLDVAFISQREDWMQSLVRDGMGVSVIPRFSLLRPTLDYRPVYDPPLSRNIRFAMVDQPDAAPALDLLVQQIQAYDWRQVHD